MCKPFILAIIALLCGAAAFAQSPIVTVGGGDLDFRAQAAHLALLGPASGAADRPTFRAITLADLPAALGGSGFMNYLGAWSGSTAYAVNDVVTDSRAVYVCTAAHTNHEPPNGTYWAALTAQGLLNYRAAWSGSTAYAVNDVVTDSSVTYVCTAAHTNHEPPNGSYWAALSAIGSYTAAGGSGETTVGGINEYLIVLNTGNALTTDTHSLLPANSQITGVSWYINTTITGTSVTGFSIGLAGDAAAYFCAAGTSLTAGLSGVCSGQYTNGLWNSAVGNITITAAGGTASAGKVRVAVHYITITPPTS